MTDPSIVEVALRLTAPRETVFRALTTADGLAGWWTTHVRMDVAAVGARIAFTFRGAFNPQMRSTEINPSTHVGWEGVEGHAVWRTHTANRFELEVTSGGTLVRFWHQVGRELSDDTVATATFKWGYYLDSLRLLCAMGHGKPFRAGTAGSRVGASGIG